MLDGHQRLHERVKEAFDRGDFDGSLELCAQLRQGQHNVSDAAVWIARAAELSTTPNAAIAASTVACKLIAACSAADAACSAADHIVAKALYHRAMAFQRLGDDVKAHADLLDAAQVAGHEADDLIMQALRRMDEEAWAPAELTAREADDSLFTCTTSRGAPWRLPAKLLPAPQSAASLLRASRPPTQDQQQQQEKEGSDLSATERSADNRPRRYASDLRGGHVPHCSLDVPSEAAYANLLLARNLPVVLTGGAVIGQTSVAGTWTANGLLRKLAGSSQVAVVAPISARRRFSFYSSAHHVGDYRFRAFHREDSARKTSVVVDQSVVVAHERAGCVDIGDANDAGAEAASAAAVTDGQGIPYFQIRVYTRTSGGFDSCELPEGAKAELLGSVDWTRLEEIGRRAAFGPLLLSQLFIAPHGALSPMHFDDQHNVFCQLAGRKSFLIFAPDHAAPHVSPYPYHHCADRRARLDVSAEPHAAKAVQGMHQWPLTSQEDDATTSSAGAGAGAGDAAAAAALRGSAVEAVLEAGDTLVLPALWWHHVHALDAESVSISFWMSRAKGAASCLREAIEAAKSSSPSTALSSSNAKPSSATNAHTAPCLRELRLRLAREVEASLGELIGPMNVRAFLHRLIWRCEQPWGLSPHAIPNQAPRSLDRSATEWPFEYKLDTATWSDDLAQGEADLADTLELEPRLQNWLMSRLAALLGADAVHAFLHEYLGARRFGGLL